MAQYTPFLTQAGADIGDAMEKRRKLEEEQNIKELTAQAYMETPGQQGAPMEMGGYIQNQPQETTAFEQLLQADPAKALEVKKLKQQEATTAEKSRIAIEDRDRKLQGEANTARDTIEADLLKVGRDWTFEQRQDYVNQKLADIHKTHPGLLTEDDGSPMQYDPDDDTQMQDLFKQKATAKKEGREVKSSEFMADGSLRTVFKDGTYEVIQATDEEKRIVADAAERGIDLKQREAQNVALGKDAAKAADEAFTQVGKINANNFKLNQIIKEIDEGADPGVIARYAPSIMEQSVRLDQLRKELGLDVVGSVTFGALSYGELQLALDVALPIGLNDQQLAQWARDKIAVQEKLGAFLTEQATFLSEGGNTRADWMQKVHDRGEGFGYGTPEAQTATPAATPAATPEPKVDTGTVYKGYRYKGGDRSKQESWVKE